MGEQKREQIEIVDAPQIALEDSEKAGEAILKFYKALGWNSDTEILDPCKVRTTQAVFDRLYDVIYEKCPDPVSVGMLMVNSGPGVDSNVPPNKVCLLPGWTRRQ